MVTDIEMPHVFSESKKGGREGRLYLGQTDVGPCHLRSVIWLNLGKKSKRSHFTIDEVLFIRAVAVTKPNLARSITKVIALRSLRGLSAREVSIRLGRPSDLNLVDRVLRSGYRELKDSRSLQKTMGYTLAFERSVSRGDQFQFGVAQ